MGNEQARVHGNATEPNTSAFSTMGWGIGLPVLTAVLTVTTLGAQNADRGIRPWDFVAPLALAVPVALLCWVVAGWVVRQAYSRGLLASTVTATLLMGGLVAGGVAVRPQLSWAELLVTLALPMAPFWVWKAWQPQVSRATARYLGVSGMILLLFTLVSLRPMFWEGQQSNGAARIGIEGRAGGSVEKPDMYFILLDAYSGIRSLDEIYGLNIEPFIQALEDFGFEVARESYANYTSTFLSMSSMLNWGYPDGLLKGKSADDRGRAPFYSLLHNNATTRFLRELGYEIVYYRSSYPPLRSSPVADVHIPTFGVAEFEQRWLAQTLFLSGIRGYCRIASCGGADGPVFMPDAAVDHERKFEALALPRKVASPPVFHMAHFLLPHEPFLFEKDCSHRDTAYWPSIIDETNESAVREMYASQVKCLNRKVIQTIARILEQASEPPIIIIQSDHGYARFADGRPPELHTVSEDRVRERLDLFAAYRIPGEGSEIVYDGITPVNALRGVFREGFGLELPSLPDRSFWSSFQRPYDFIEVDPKALWRQGANAEGDRGEPEDAAEPDGTE